MLTWQRHLKSSAAVNSLWEFFGSYSTILGACGRDRQCWLSDFCGCDPSDSGEVVNLVCMAKRPNCGRGRRKVAKPRVAVPDPVAEIASDDQ